jgi:hypothetical protein
MRLVFHVDFHPFINFLNLECFYDPTATLAHGFEWGSHARCLGSGPLALSLETFAHRGAVWGRGRG